MSANAEVSAVRSPESEYVGPPKDMFLDPAWFERDLEAIFRPRWMFAGHVDEISESGRYITFSLGDDQVLILRDQHGDVRAFHNVCAHRGARLCQSETGRIGRRIVCPYHAWTYSPADGRLLSAHSMHDDFDMKPWGLHQVHAEVWQGLIFVCLANDRPTPISEQFAGHEHLGGYNFNDTKIAAVQTTVVEANWKVVIENDKECYHCPSNHPELIAVQDWRDHGTPAESFETIMRDGASGLRNVTVTEDQGRLNTVGNNSVCRLPLSRADSNPEPASFALSWWPGLTLGLARDYAKILAPKPLNAGQTEARVYWFVHKDAEERRDYELDEVTAFWRATYAQDRDICENVYKGMKSRAYTPGPLNRIYQSGQAAFYAWYMTEIRRHFPELVDGATPGE